MDAARDGLVIAVTRDVRDLEASRGSIHVAFTLKLWTLLPRVLMQKVRRLHRPSGLGDGVLDLLQVTGNAGLDDLFHLRVFELRFQLPKDALGGLDGTRVGFVANSVDHLVRVADAKPDAAREVAFEDQKRRDA